jgi:hypothetical protein
MRHCEEVNKLILLFKKVLPTKQTVLVKRSDLGKYGLGMPCLCRQVASFRETKLAMTAEFSSSLNLVVTPLHYHVKI